MTELYAALRPVLDEHDNHHGQQVEAQKEEAGSERAVQLAIMGLPNVASVESPFVYLALSWNRLLLTEKVLPWDTACLSAASHIHRHCCCVLMQFIPSFDVSLPIARPC